LSFLLDRTEDFDMSTDNFRTTTEDFGIITENFLCRSGDLHFSSTFSVSMNSVLVHKTFPYHFLISVPTGTTTEFVSESKSPAFKRKCLRKIQNREAIPGQPQLREKSKARFSHRLLISSFLLLLEYTSNCWTCVCWLSLVYTRKVILPHVSKLRPRKKKV
jgi:hypothetical protein